MAVKAPSNKVKLFVLIDALNNEPTASGSINSKEYSFPRGTTIEVPENLAIHMIAVGQAITM